MKNEIKQVIFVGVLTFFFQALWFIPFAFGVVDPFISGFAVDSSSRIYIKKIHCIEVFNENQQVLNKIISNTSRGYQFTIQQDDTILLATPSKVYILDGNGDILDSWDDSLAKTYQDFQKINTTYTCSTGDIYKIENFFTLSKIVKNNTDVVYRITPYSFFSKLFIYATVLCYIDLGVLLIRHNIRENKNRARHRLSEDRKK